MKRWLRWAYAIMTLGALIVSIVAFAQKNTSLGIWAALLVVVVLANAYAGERGARWRRRTG